MTPDSFYLGAVGLIFLCAGLAWAWVEMLDRESRAR